MTGSKRPTSSKRKLNYVPKGKTQYDMLEAMKFAEKKHGQARIDEDLSMIKAFHRKNNEDSDGFDVKPGNSLTKASSGARHYRGALTDAEGRLLHQQMKTRKEK